MAAEPDQDRAAGGREARRFELRDGRRVLMWVVLRTVAAPRRALLATVGWRGSDGRLRERVVGYVDDAEPEAALGRGWRLVHAHGWP